MIASYNNKIGDKVTQPNCPDQDLETPKNDLLDFSNGQNHTSDQLDQAIQTYWADGESLTASREVNGYHVAQASQAKHGYLDDRGTNGIVAGLDVRMLSTSPM